MREKGPAADSPFDLSVAALVAGVLSLSLASAAVVIRFQLRARRLRRLLSLSSLWPVRLLLVLLSSLLSLSELLRLPLLRRRLPSPLSPRLCAAYSVISPSLAEPAFFSTLLFLLCASTRPAHKPDGPHRPLLSATASALAASLPFILLNALFICLPNALLPRLGLPPDFLGHAAAAADAFSPRRARGHRRRPCAQPLFDTVLLAGLAAVYVPLFVSAVWRAVDVVINKRLRTRLYALATAVVSALSVQVAARALAALWNPASASSQALNLAAFVGLLIAVIAGLAILVVQPAVDSMAAVDHRLRPCAAGDGGVVV